MTTREKKEYLSEYIDLIKERLEVEEIYRQIDRQKIYHVQAQVLTDMPFSHVGGADTVGSKLAKRELTEEMAERRLAKLDKDIARIENAIYSVKYSIYRRLLTKRYMQRQIWDQIALDMGMSRDYIDCLHGKALEMIQI